MMYMQTINKIRLEWYSYLTKQTSRQKLLLETKESFYTDNKVNLQEDLTTFDVYILNKKTAVSNNNYQELNFLQNKETFSKVIQEYI